MHKREKCTLRKFIDELGIKAQPVYKTWLKELASGLIQEIMDAELEEELDYSKYDYKNKQTDMHATVTTKRPSSAAKVTSY